MTFIVVLIESSFPYFVRVMVTGRQGVPSIDGHCGFVAGEYRDGLLSDTWTDVTRCARGTFVGLVPACSCGWRGEVRPVTASGLETCQLSVATEHLSDPGRVRSAAFGFSSALADRPVIQSQVHAPLAVPQSVSI
jgi:hypothetical protein